MATRPAEAPPDQAQAWGRLARFCRRSAGNALAVLRTPTFLVILVENISNLTRATGGYHARALLLPASLVSFKQQKHRVL